MAQQSQMPSHLRTRAATLNDVEGMTDVFFHSFNAKFFQYLWPDVPTKRQWMNEVWPLGLKNPTDRTFVVTDTKNGDRIVAFSRWQIPNTDSNHERIWPDVNEKLFDMEVAGPFFGGMETNRETMMEDRPHWFLELLGVHEDYQKLGIGASLIQWGSDQADRDGLELYLDASEIGRPYYIKHHNFTPGVSVLIPDRPEYGSFVYRSVVRPPQKSV